MSETKVYPRVAFALDVSTPEEANRFIQLLEPHVAAFKVGLEYFIANREIPETKVPIILDLKLHDIPETVARATARACELSRRIEYITMHVQQRTTIVETVKVADHYGVQMLGVTVLTSMSDQDILDIENVPNVPHQLCRDLVRPSVEARVRSRVAHGKASGLTGFVCSPKEVKLIREDVPGAFLLVPGVRQNAESNDDQKRIGTPVQAIADGASMVVIGRPIRDAKDPVAVIKQINNEIGDFLSARVDAKLKAAGLL